MKTVVYNKAVGFLARRAYFSCELKAKLINKFTTDNLEIINATINKLIDLKFLDDQNTANLYIEELQRKRYAKKYIVGKFLLKGCSINFAKSMLEKYYNKEVETINLNYFKEKKLHDNSIKAKFKFNNFLKQRGFY